MPAWLRDLLADLLPRGLAVRLGVRRLTPWGLYWPRASVEVAPMATGGAYRASLRRQDPSIDPREPNGGESTSAGNEHGWANCTMASGATAMAYQDPRGSDTPWGGDLRHHQSDMTGGTDLYDLRQAWDAYGEVLTIRTGQGWSGVTKAHGEGRALVVQGQGNVPGSQSFDGGHACVIAPETHSDGRWLFGDPLASDWQWVSQGSIRTWMEAMGSGCYFAVGDKPTTTAPTPPDPDTGGTPTPDRYPDGWRDGHARGVVDGSNQAMDAVFASWDPWPAPPIRELGWDLDAWVGVAETPVGDAAWEVAPIPMNSLRMAQAPAAWAGTAGWAAGLWRE